MFGEPRRPEATNSQISKSKEVTGEAIKMTEEEHRILLEGGAREEAQAGGAKYRAFLDLAISKGITINSGFVRIRLAGVDWDMNTDTNDFGTLRKVEI